MDKLLVSEAGHFLSLKNMKKKEKKKKKRKVPVQKQRKVPKKDQKFFDLETG